MRLNIIIWKILLKNLNNESIFKNAQVDVGGYAVIWGEDLDISCEELYKNGVLKIEDWKEDGWIIK